ncbi:DUF2142 domain-containing protein [Konateibacter massiliensis]|uniref:DUF2142 domain-containing protein n=1 Tax=Konateibacter massiliensis TaxID=2002841 RepID=UPI000C159E49|nr:DUF2142 domain-containing protein [Konateibacter massiliensis]
MDKISTKWVKNGIIVLGIVALAFLIECLGFNWHSIFHANKTAAFDLGQSSEAIGIEQGETLVPLTDEEIQEIELNKENAKLLAEINGEEYVETVDPSLIDDNGTLSRKVYTTNITIDMGEEYYVKKFSIAYPTEANLGYEINLVNGEKESDTIYDTLNYRLKQGTTNVNETGDKMVVNLKTSSAFTPQGMIITISNEFQINHLRVIFLIGGMLAIAFLVFNRRIFQKRLEIAFAIFSLLFGIFIIVFDGTNQLSWDEYVHYENAYRASFGQTIEYTEASIQMKGRIMPSFDTLEEKKLIAAYAQERNDYSVADIKNQQRFVQYNVRAYLPQSIMLAMARVLNLSFASAYMLGKLGNLLFYTIIMALAIRISKVGKIYIAIIGLLPTPLFLASVYAYDAVITALVFLGFVIWLNEILDKEKKLEWYTALAMILCFVVGTWSKTIYMVMMLLLCFLPKEKFDGKLRSGLFRAGVVVIVGLLLITIYKSPIEATGATADLQSNTAYLGDIRAQGANLEDQAKYVLSQPLAYTKVLLRSLKNSAFDYLLGTSTWLLYGYVGRFPTVFAALTSLLILGASLFQTKEDRQYVLAAKWKVLLGVMAFGMASLIWTGLYVTFTKVGANYISGVQGRYYIPFILPLMFVFKNNKCKLNISTEVFHKAVFAILIFINLYGTYVYFLKPHCF